ncbi:hypothetical protein [uncultured Pseudacidovorax sp.]|uniref:hypothetical protein n=1 Tax=uncultured Pseudacidovorax sp. TaxID=679313 RepID=UPI0025DE31A7|nr:hypothetical protein [uncultured Pseudacidovorax sp.]
MSDFSKVSDADLLRMYQQANTPPAPLASAFANLSDAELLRQYQAATGDGYKPPFGMQTMGNAGAGLIRGAGSVASTLIDAGKAAAGVVRGEGWNFQEDAGRRKAMDDAFASLGVDPDSAAYKVGKVGGEVAATWPVGGIFGKAATMAGAPALGNALATGGMRAADAVGPGVAQGARNLLLRGLGGAVTGGASAGLVSPQDAGTGAAIGAALPVVGKVAGAGAETASALLRPFTAKGQDRITSNVLREFATDPEAARAALQASRELVPGSAPTSAMAAGDAGLAALSRAMQNANPEYASSLAARTTAQNQARTAAIEEIAGNTGKIDLAKAARDELTAPMREAALSAAGQVPANGILSSIDRLLADPNNAGKLSQQALNEFRNRIAQFSKDGAIDARALYAIRKDINDVLGGRLQGEAGNLRYAAGQLTGVKGIIDDAIDQASRRVPASTSRELATAAAPNQVGPYTAGITAESATPTWRGYLETYAKESIPINQMKKLDEILKQVQTGSVDSQGGLVLSAAKLNNLLKNKGAELGKELSAEQMDVLRRIQADLNAGQLVNNTGRAVGSNTLQNMAQNQILESALGKTLGGSVPMQTTVGRLMQLPYGAANKQLQEKLSAAMLDPETAAKLLTQPQAFSGPKNALLRGVAAGAYRFPPLLAAQD